MHNPTEGHLLKNGVLVLKDGQGEIFHLKGKYYNIDNPDAYKPGVKEISEEEFNARKKGQ